MGRRPNVNTDGSAHDWVNLVRPREKPADWVHHDNGFFYSLQEPEGVTYVYFESWVPGARAIWLDTPEQKRPKLVRVADDVSIPEMLECIRWRNYTPMQLLKLKLCEV